MDSSIASHCENAHGYFAYSLQKYPPQKTKTPLKGVDERGQVTGRQCGVACSGRRHGQMVKGTKKYRYH